MCLHGEDGKDDSVSTLDLGTGPSHTEYGRFLQEEEQPGAVQGLPLVLCCPLREGKGWTMGALRGRMCICVCATAPGSCLSPTRQASVRPPSAALLRAGRVMFQS